MDYSSYFTAAPPPYQFFNLPPTPAHSQTPHGEDGNVSPDGHFDASYQSFDPSFPSFDSQVIGEPRIPSKSPYGVASASVNDANVNGVQSVSTDGGDDAHPGGGRSSSEEKEMLTPAQSRRKAQNRAAQRAFRERKERHVKDLEQKLNSLEEASSSLHSENEKLKRELAKVATENEILRATSGAGSHDGGRGGQNGHRDDDMTIAPMRFKPKDFVHSVLEAHQEAQKNHQKTSGTTAITTAAYHNTSPSSPSTHSPLSQLPIATRNNTSHNYSPTNATANNSLSPHYAHRITYSEKTGEKLLNAGATWDLIQSHEMFVKGLVDVGDVSDRLKAVARCDGQGPVFEEGDVRRIIEESVAGGRDELI